MQGNSSRRWFRQTRKINLPATVAYQIAGVNKGDLIEVFMDELNQKKR